MLLPFSFSRLSCFSSLQHPSSSSITPPNDTSHEPGAAEDDRIASSHSDSDLSSGTCHQTTDEDNDQSDIEGLNAYSDDESVILDNQMTNARATDVTEELLMAETPGASEVLPGLEQTEQARTGTADSEVLATGMSTHLTVTESSPAAGLSEPNNQGAAHKRWPHTSDKGRGRTSRMYLWPSCGKRAEKQQHCCRVWVLGM